MSIILISSSLQVFLIIASATIATSPTSTLPLYFGLNTIWSISSDTVCLSRLSSFDILNCVWDSSIRINGKSAQKVLTLSHEISRINQANIYLSTTVLPLPPAPQQYPRACTQPPAHLHKPCRLYLTTHAPRRELPFCQIAAGFFYY